MQHRSNMQPIVFLSVFLLFCPLFAFSYDEYLSYDYTAYTECKTVAEKPLYNGGILRHQTSLSNGSNTQDSSAAYTPALLLYNLTQATIYSFSIWVKIEGAESSLITASLNTENKVYKCVGSVLAKSGCWSFLKGGFSLHSPSNLSIIYFRNAGDENINVATASASLQPFTAQQWTTNQDYMINNVRKRAVVIHVSDKNGDALQGANITINQISKDFPFGSAIASTILNNLPYQNWFVERFNAAVFENELKWYATEPEQGKLNYTVPDKMLEFVRANQITARGHNIFWEDPKYIPNWVKNLSNSDLNSAVNARIENLMNKYKNQFIHWDVSNEMLHFDFYEQKLGPNATLQFYNTAHEADPLATLFLNEFNVVETCSDAESTVDTYISKIKELESGGVFMDGIGLESHFSEPNLALMRGVLDKLATLGLPIWLTEVDISDKFDPKTQGVLLDQVLREGYSHPAVSGIMLWTALHPSGCYRMCLTDGEFRNLPAGEVVDKLLKQWQTGRFVGRADWLGDFDFYGFLGEYEISVQYENRTSNATFSLPISYETKHFNIQL